MEFRVFDHIDPVVETLRHGHEFRIALLAGEIAKLHLLVRTQVSRQIGMLLGAKSVVLRLDLTRLLLGHFAAERVLRALTDHWFQTRSSICCRSLQLRVEPEA